MMNNLLLNEKYRVCISYLNLALHRYTKTYK